MAVNVLKPKIIESTDVIVQVTGSSICGSDLHLYHGRIPLNSQLEHGLR